MKPALIDTDILSLFSILIAGVAMFHDVVLVTHNVQHFNRIEDLEVTDWSAS